MSKTKFFISYRRESGIDLAARISSFLRDKGYDVFYDITSMQLGRFDEQIIDNIKKSTFFLLILSKGALDRCGNENDWVRLEIECAIKNKIQIVPLILPQFEFPKDLPKSLEELPYFHGIEYNAVLFDLIMEKIIQMIDPRTQQKSQLGEMLASLYDVTVRYRNALKKGNQQEYNVATKELVSLLQDLYNYAEKNHFSNAQLSQRALDIVNQFNAYVPHFNAFSDSRDRMSAEAQLHAQHAEMEFNKFVELILETKQFLDTHK